MEKQIEIFDRQIKREIREANELELCPSYWNKKLFIESIGLSSSDWREIRSGDFWDRYNRKGTPIERIVFTLSRIDSYKKTNG